MLSSDINIHELFLFVVLTGSLGGINLNEYLMHIAILRLQINVSFKSPPVNLYNKQLSSWEINCVKQLKRFVSFQFIENS